MPHALHRTGLVLAAVLALTSPVLAGGRRPLPPKAPTAITVAVEYQRVGRALLDLKDQRGKFDCADLIPRFKAIKLDQALATPTSRTEASVELADIAAKIHRLRGVQLDAACLDNPLAAGCR